ncbi:MAG: hypothetical protein KF773_13710 [Deltaproteobacteria bacterium]|nr:hypothetical protein [Deltaproteobacteria bacterium]MCW5806009.1 hypothetical protein [Deltaproteobacteria bacterium]
MAVSSGLARAGDAVGDKPAEPPEVVKLDPPAKARPIAIHDGTRDPNGPGRNCEPNAMGQLECKASAISQ